MKLPGLEIPPRTQAEILDEVTRSLRRPNPEPSLLFTPNLDHLALLEQDEAFRLAYTRATWLVPDGKPLIWLSRCQGRPLPERITGVDLFAALLARAHREQWRIFLLGARPEVNREARKVWRDKWPGLQIDGLSPPWGFDSRPAELADLVEKVRQSRPHILALFIGSPRQEVLAVRLSEALGTPLILGLGGTLDMLTGQKKRAPRFLQNAGLEWAWRLIQEPFRLAPRYLGRDLPVLLRLWRRCRAEQRQRPPSSEDI